MEQMTYCHKCELLSRPGAKFCDKCGKQFEPTPPGNQDIVWNIVGDWQMHGRYTSKSREPMTKDEAVKLARNPLYHSDLVNQLFYVVSYRYGDWTGPKRPVLTKQLIDSHGNVEEDQGPSILPMNVENLECNQE